MSLSVKDKGIESYLHNELCYVCNKKMQHVNIFALCGD